MAIQCFHPTCRRTVILTPAEAMALLGPDGTIEQADQRLRCSACGARGRIVPTHLQQVKGALRRHDIADVLPRPGAGKCACKAKVWPGVIRHRTQRRACHRNVRRHAGKKLRRLLCDDPLRHAFFPHQRVWLNLAVLHQRLNRW